MRDPDLTSLRLFASACDLGSMSRAADAAGMVASAVSKRLAQLEATVGQRLLERSQGRLVPTPAGSTLLEHARSMLLSAARIERDMAQHLGGLQGRVNVLATASAIAEALPDDLAAFLRLPAHANIQLDLEERVSSEVVRGVREREAAIGICWDAAETSLLQTLPYRSDHLCVAVPRGHALQALPTVRLADTLEHEQVCLPPQSAITAILMREARALGRPLRQRVIVTHLDAALRVVGAGLGIAIVPREATERSATLYGLVVLPLAEPWAQRRFTLCHRGDAPAGSAARLLLDYLATAARSTP